MSGTLELSGSPEPGEASPVAPRLGFIAFVRDAWSLFRSRGGSLIAVFSAAHIAVGIVLAVTGALILPLAILLAVVLPVIAGSFAVAVASVVLSQSESDDCSIPDARPLSAAQLIAKKPEVFKMALVAAFAALVAVVVLQQYGFLVLPLLYGPPVAMQALVAESLGLRTALTRARSLLAGNWRLVLYLLNIAIVLGLVGFMLVSAVSTFGVADDRTTSIVASILLTVVVGTSSAYLAAAQVALYRHLLRQTGPTAEQIVTPESGPPSPD